MPLVAALSVIALAAPALAHPGHFAEAGGHSHVLALAVFAVALGIADFGISRRRARRRKAHAG